ncbi:Gfo/Idh/MocA family protein [Bacillus suaedaesalsae]|uniref:Gfo/Idh/MocA family oxidoreductase n=1 Tax=Bacillus suaedaesalsae TaxID=2810349 RepID=A0ABS2DM57_9BACI|nr:Gfo/Idh/MocA family oxidoreductase [Bacillus suaedaesalsae]MBM6619582.1 Gfo/Idh/MocA family oxidoreductase [Bacillus suaedaesalsae]
MAKVKVGVVGLGAIGKRLMDGMKALFTDEIEIYAVCDVDHQLTETVSREYSVERTFTNYVELVNLPELDFVYIAVPPKFHEKVALDAIAAGKHILCEKPLANSLEEASSMLEAASGKNLIHMMNFPLNYQGAMHKMMSLLEDGYMGSLEKIELNLHFPEWPRAWQKNSWVGNREQGGYILEVGAHWIQFIQKNFGQIEYIEGEVTYPEDETLCEKSVWAKMKLDNNLIVHLDGDSNFEGIERVELVLHGTDGTLMIENWGTLKGQRSDEELYEIPTNDVEVQPIFHHMIHAYKGNPADLYDFKVGYNVQVVLEALKHPNLADGIHLKSQYK